MGWKNLKEAFEIEHQVTAKGDYIFIGSPFCHNLVNISKITGEVKQSSVFSDFLNRTYPALESASQSQILELIRRPDQFSASIPVYTFKDGEIIACLCEQLDYPNVTHDGQMMYENQFSTDRETVIGWAKRDLESWHSMLADHIKKLENDLAASRSQRAIVESKMRMLETQQPDTQPARSEAEHDG